MSGETHPEGGRAANDPPPIKAQEEGGQGDSAEASGEHAGAPEGGGAAEEAGAAASSGPKAYVDPAIAAEAKIAELEAQVAEMRDRYMRAYAESENLRKRTEREKADIAKYAVSSFARDMVAIGDNLGRAIEAANGADEEQTGPMKALLEGVALTDQELRKALEKHGVRSIAADGEIFDPHKHQAVMEQDDPSVPAGTILQVFQEGYQIEDRVLRPSMVVVAKGGAKPTKPSAASVNIDETAVANDAGGPSADERQAGDAVGEAADEAAKVDDKEKGGDGSV